MAKLGPYFGGHTGTLKIYVGFFPVGSGQFAAFSDYQAKFKGSYQFAGQSGTFSIEIKLTDQNAQSATGPCSINLNGNADNAATYQTSNGKLTVTTALNAAAMDIHVKDGGTQVDNISGHNIWFGPWS